MTEPISFFSWLIGLWSSYQLEQLIVYIIVGILGIVAHYIKQYLTENVKGSIYKYMVKDSPKRSLAMILTFIGSAIGYVLSGATDGMTWASLIGLAFTTGYSLDSSINRSTTK